MSDTMGSGPTSVDKFMTEGGPTDDLKYDKALEEAFGDTTPSIFTQGQTLVADEPKTDETTATATGETATGDETVEGADPSLSQGGESDKGGEEEESSGATGGAIDFPALFESQYGRPPTQDDLEGLLHLTNWAAALTPEQRDFVNNALVNNGVYTPPQQQIAPEPIPDPLEEEYKDDPLYQRIRQVEEFTAAQAQRQVVEQQAQAEQQVIVGKSHFNDRYKLTDPELAALEGAVIQSRIFPGLVAAYGNDISRAAQAAFEHVYMTHPTFRAGYEAKIIEAAKDKQAPHEIRKANASSVTSGGGNGASRTAAPPKTNGDRWGAVTDALRESMNDGQPSN